MRLPPARSQGPYFYSLLAVAFVATTGCQSSTPLMRVGDVARTATAAVAAADPIVYRTVGGPLDEPDAPPDRLTLDGAVRLALGSSPEIQASLARVRAAEADADQAGLLPNPVLNVVFRLPTSGGKPQVEASLAEDLIAILLRPQRTSVADARLRASGGEAVAVVLNTLAEVQTRYAAVQALDALLPVLEERRRLLARLLELAQARLQGGEGTQLDVTVAQAQRSDLEVEVSERLLERRQERLTLARLVGQPSGAATWQLTPWEVPPRLTAAESAWIEAGLSQRTDLRVRQYELAARETEARLTRLEVFGPGGVGIDAQRDPDWAVGPAINVPLPVFDMGQARRAKSEAMVVEARHELTRSRRDIVEGIRKAYDAASTSADTLRRVRDELVPLQQKRRDQAEAAYRAGQTDITTVILADQDFQAARARLIELENRTTRAVIDLERAAGGPAVASELRARGNPLPTTNPSGAAVGTTQPATRDVTSPTDK